MASSINDINITEDSVKEFYNSIDTEALIDSLRKMECTTRRGDYMPVAIGLPSECDQCGREFTKGEAIVMYRDFTFCSYECLHDFIDERADESIYEGDVEEW